MTPQELRDVAKALEGLARGVFEIVTNPTVQKVERGETGEPLLEARDFIDAGFATGALTRLADKFTREARVLEEDA